MLTAVEGYYDGNRIVMDENIKMYSGQRVIITILDSVDQQDEKRKMNLNKYRGRGKKMFHSDAAQYVKELRADDRIQFSQMISN